MFIIEDGTGIEDANAYVDIEIVEKYLNSDRLAQFNDLSDENKEAAIIAGTQLVDISFEWIGNRRSLEQGLNWPRTDAELHGFTIEGIPPAVKKATCEAVWLSMTEDSLFSNENNREVSRERIEGAVDISYVNPKDRDKKTITRFEILDRILWGLYIIETHKGSSTVGSASVERA